MSQENANQLIIELAKTLNVSEIDDTTLQLCVKLIDQGVDPKQLAEHIIRIKRETAINL